MLPAAQALVTLVKDFSENIRDLRALAILKSNPCTEAELKVFSSKLCETELLLDELERQAKQEQSLVSKSDEICLRFKLANARAAKLQRGLQKLETDHGQDEEDNSEVMVEEQVMAVPFGRVEQISLPTQADFDRLPRYKKTVDFEPLKWTVHFVNLAAAKKKQILTSVGKLSDKEKGWVKTWKLQDSVEVNARFFITDEDIIESLDMKKLSISNMRAGLECLRTLEFLLLSQSGEVKRYILLK